MCIRDRPDTIHNNEASWIDNASFGATTFWKQYAGNVHSFDVNSHYPNVMNKNFNLFPMREGEFKHIENITDKAEYGIYRCVISNPENKVLKLFRFNPLNYYTHYDIELAKQYDLKIELIQDEQPNFLFYSKDKLVNGAFLFKHYINDIYALKEKKIGCSKDLLNVLYGGLCEKRHTKFSVDTETELNITNAKIVNLYTTEDKIKIKVISYKYGYYRTSFARILPFVLGLGRDKDSCLNWIKQNRNNKIKEFKNKISHIIIMKYLLRDKLNDISTHYNSLTQIARELDTTYSTVYKSYLYDIHPETTKKGVKQVQLKFDTRYSVHFIK